MRARSIVRPAGWLTAACSIALAASAALAAKPTWDQVANVKQAAERLATMHRRQGSDGVMKFLDACYRTHTLSETFTSGLEACMAQDYMHSRALVIVYARLPAEARQKGNIPSVEQIAATMGQRLGTVFAKYKISNADAEAFRQRVDTHGFPAFVKAVFPGAADAPNATPNSNEQKKP